MARNAIVTGAAGTLGRAVVMELARQGYAVTGIDLAPEAEIEGLTSYNGGVNLADAAAVDGVFARLEGERDGLHALVNAAGGFQWQTLEDGSADMWGRMFEMNLRTAVVCTRAALPLLRRGGGAIVNIGAAGATRAAAGMGAYAASKAGIAKLTESLAEEEKDRGVRVNAVLPSIIDTPVNRADMPDADFARWVQPSALAGIIAFLLSDGAAAITGALIPVTGRC